MRTVRTALLAGIAVIGLAGLAAAQGPAVHTMTIRLPGGGIETIHYSGDVAPKVMLAPRPMIDVAPGFVSFWPDPAFAQLDRISQAMDRQMSTMMRRAEMLTTQPSGASSTAALRGMPEGSSYSFVSTFAGNGVCMRSMQITSTPNGGKPKVVEHTSGNCKGAPGLTTSVMQAAPSPDSLQTVSVSAPASRSGMHEVGYWRRL